MSSVTRRRFLRQGTVGLAALGAGGLVLHAGAGATPESGDLGGYGGYLRAKGETPDAPPPPPPQGPATKPAGPAAWAPTEPNILGPYYRGGAPYRAKVTPPLAAGTVMLISGRVWALDTRRPLAGATLDIWQADAEGRYDNDDPARPPQKDSFVNRARMLTDEEGRYQFETIHPGRYLVGENAWRPAHIHYLVRAPGYMRLVTQLYFQGDPENERDAFIRPSLIIELKSIRVTHGSYEAGAFDVVLARAV